MLTSTLFCSFLFISPIALAAGKTAKCQIDENGKTIYKGKCTFTPEGNGSFYLSGASLSKGIGLEGLMVWMEDKNVAVVQGTKFRGGAETWGQAERSTTQKACWVGEGNSFKVCAW